MRDVKGFLSRKQSEGGPLASDWAVLGELYEKKLWHQLTLKLAQFVKDDYFVQNEGLVEMYENFLADFEHRINMLSLMEIVLYVVKEMKGAVYYWLSHTICTLSLKPTEIPTPSADWKVLGNDNDVIVPVVTDSTIEDYQKAKYAGAKGQYRLPISSRLAECFHLLFSPVDEKVDRALHLSLAALLGSDIYNFGELLAHPILESLKGTQHGWLIELLYAFNSGDLAKFEELKRHWQQQGDLNRNYKNLQQKISLLCLMELTFKRPSNDRNLSFEVIAKEAQLPLEEVQYEGLRSFRSTAFSFQEQRVISLLSWIKEPF
ncbi:PREDICTED: 26S proteasome non-ATPase regulatory subunit 13-like [Acropora digitifera]|uniref:26S proteasome non-ATPase regulatory subunit 13-like n=1 Tax=Acropora digitifera TaxID=70779 RepID=UPI000779F854|nr:PREDICTED: 26S proteasome non-ATPase regulatory subunit 13-like [Acropora digitifera]